MSASELEAIRHLYYGATRATIARDFDRAIDLLKALPDEEARERATVYMQGLAEMKQQWLGRSPGNRMNTKHRKSRSKS
jgi:hypothetical protein